MSLSPEHLDQLHRIARRLEVARLALVGLGTDASHEAVEEALIDVHADLRALADEVAA